MSTLRSPKPTIIYFLLGVIGLVTLLGAIGVASAFWCVVLVARWIGG